jgi:hypothetical protein
VEEEEESWRAERSRENLREQLRAGEREQARNAKQKRGGPSYNRLTKIG